MTQAIKRTLSILLAVAVIFSFSVIGFAAGGTAKLDSAKVTACNGNFKDRYVSELKFEIKASDEIEMTDSFAILFVGSDGVNVSLDKNSVISADIADKSGTIVVSCQAVLSHEAEYTLTIIEDSFKLGEDASEEYVFETTGNLILEGINVERPTTTIQRLVEWISGWKYAKYIQFVLDILLWFDSL